MKSTSIAFTGPRRAELLQEDVPEPGPGQVTVQTLVSLISTGTESWCYRGEFDADTGWASWVKYPFYPGYSNVARVIKVGEGVAGLREGDRVFSMSNHRQLLNLSADSRNVIKLQDDISDEAAVWSKLATITQTGVRLGEHAMGDAAVVIGLGPIGQLVVQYLRALGLWEVLAIDTAQARLDVALKHGATQAFCGSAGDAKPFVEQHTDGRLADVVYDVTGHYAVLPLALRLVRDFGTLVLLGDSPHPSRQCLAPDLLTRQIKLRGSHNEKLPPAHEAWVFPRQVRLFHEYVRRSHMRVHDLITHHFRPQDAPRVYDGLQRDRTETLGVVFDWR